MTKFKTEKRPAKVGEKILITDAGLNGDRYRNGDVSKVVRSSEYWVDVAEHGIHVYHEEYEVIIGGKEMGGIIEKMQAEIDELKAKVGALEKRDNAKPFEVERAGSIPYYRKLNKSPQARRDEIVAQAKADVAALVYGTPMRTPYNSVEFIVNNEKRTVVALLGIKFAGKIVTKGIAKCAPDDCFNSHIGRAIALRRALGLPVPSEYLNAPQPAEVRVGDVVRCGINGKFYTVTRFCDDEIATKDYGRPFRFDEGSGWLGTNQVTIIDDSRENV